MEFKIISPSDDGGFLQSIEFNFEELKTQLTESLEKYKGLTYTEETLKEAKADKAGLNKFKEAIETRRKEIKKLCLKPYDEFEIKVKELVALVNEPIQAIDTQLKDFEDKRISAKRCDILDMYNVIFAGFEGFINFEKVFNPSWDNITYNNKKIETELKELKSKIEVDLKTIEELNLKENINIQVRDVYFKTFSLASALQEKTRIEEIEAKYIEENKQTKAVEELTSSPVIVQEKTYTRKFWVTGTKQQLIDLGKYLDNNKLEYGGIN